MEGRCLMAKVQVRVLSIDRQFCHKTFIFNLYMNQLIQKVLTGGISELISKFFKKLQRKPQVIINVYAINNGNNQTISIGRVD